MSRQRRRSRKPMSVLKALWSRDQGQHSYRDTEKADEHREIASRPAFAARAPAIQAVASLENLAERADAD